MYFYVFLHVRVLAQLWFSLLDRAEPFISVNLSLSSRDVGIVFPIVKATILGMSAWNQVKSWFHSRFVRLVCPWFWRSWISSRSRSLQWTMVFSQPFQRRYIPSTRYQQEWNIVSNREESQVVCTKVLQPHEWMS